MFSWQFIIIENKPYLFKLTNIAHDRIEFKLSDFKILWTETLDHTAILARSKV